MTNLKVNILGKEFKNPIITASGTFGFGREYDKFYDIGILGGVCTKGMTREKRLGNPPPRIAETPSGMLNSVGLQNPGVEEFIKKDLEFLKSKNTVIIANIAGSTEDDYCYMAERLDKEDIDMLELNISCPNVKCGGVAFGIYPDSIKHIVSLVRKSTTKPLIVKLSPNVADIRENAIAAVEAGADALSLINTLTGMMVDIKTRRPILKNLTGGMSGPAVKPVALRMVYQVSQAVDVPIIGMGGITTAKDVIEFMLCGASAVQVGTANIMNPLACVNILNDLNKYLEDNNIKDINELIGGLIVE